MTGSGKIDLKATPIDYEIIIVDECTVFSDLSKV